MQHPVPINEPLFIGNEVKYLEECIKTGWVSSEGPFVKEFEDRFSSMVGRKYGVAVANGSAALDVSIAALGIGKNDEVILPSFTIISCAFSIVRAGAVPVVVDANPITWNMDVNKIEEKITPKTKAIMAVHIYGIPTDMEPLLSLAEKYGLKVIEDAAEMHGQNYKGKPCGSFGEISTFSFYSNKNMTTGEGGMIVSDDEELAEKSRFFRNLCFQTNRRFVHEEMGWNYRMSNLQAAVGLAQMESLETFVERKRKMGKRYNELLKSLHGLQLPLPSTEYADNIYWVYGIVLEDDVPFDAVKAMKIMGENKIGTRPFFWPIHEQPVFKKMGLFENESCPVSEKISRRGFYIPSGMAITERQIECVAKVLRNSISL